MIAINDIARLLEQGAAREYRELRVLPRHVTELAAAMESGEVDGIGWLPTLDKGRLLVVRHDLVSEIVLYFTKESEASHTVAHFERRVCDPPCEPRPMTRIRLRDKLVDVEQNLVPYMPQVVILRKPMPKVDGVGLIQIVDVSRPRADFSTARRVFDPSSVKLCKHVLFGDQGETPTCMAKADDEIVELCIRIDQLRLEIAGWQRELTMLCDQAIAFDLSLAALSMRVEHLIDREDP